MAINLEDVMSTETNENKVIVFIRNFSNIKKTSMKMEKYNRLFYQS